MAVRGTYVRICGGNMGPKSQGPLLCALLLHPSRWAPLRPQRVTDHKERRLPPKSQTNLAVTCKRRCDISTLFLPPSSKTY